MASLLDDIQGLEEEVKEYRKHIHMHPEIGLETKETEKYVRTILENCEVEFLPSSIGLIALIDNPRAEDYIAFRADMDALPIQEKNTHDFISKNPGKMHACGHDGHTAILTGLGKYLSQNKDLLKHKVLLIFQPGEEGPFPGGAHIMVKDLENLNILKKIKYIFALHITTEIPVSKFGIRYGSSMASTDEFFIKFLGKEGHTSEPQNAIDAISTAAKFVMMIESFMNKGIDPLIPTVFSIGKIQGGNARNIVAGECSLEGTIRNQDEKTRALILSKIKDILDALKLSTHCDYELEITHGLPVLCNNEKAIDFVKGVISEKLNPKQIEMLENPAMGAEDFAFFAEQIPAAFIWLGAGFKDKDKNTNLHNPHFDFNEDALLYGIELFSSIALSK